MLKTQFLYSSASCASALYLFLRSQTGVCVVFYALVLSVVLLGASLLLHRLTALLLQPAVLVVGVNLPFVSSRPCVGLD